MNTTNISKSRLSPYDTMILIMIIICASAGIIIIATIYPLKPEISKTWLNQCIVDNKTLPQPTEYCRAQWVINELNKGVQK